MTLPKLKFAVGAAVGAGVGYLEGLLKGQRFSLTPLKYDPSKGSLEILKNEEFTIDAVVSEGETRSVSVTNYTLETGGSFAEHANQLAFTLSVSGVISDASLSYGDLASSARGSAIGSALGFPSKSQKAYDTMTKWAETAQPLLVKTKFKQQGYFKGKGSSLQPVPFVIESFSVNRTKDVGSAISFSMVVREIRLIGNVKASTNLLPIIPTDKPPVIDKGGGGPENNQKSQNAALKNASEVGQTAFQKTQELLSKSRK